MADVSVDIELVTSAFNKALKQAGDNIQGFQVKVQRSEKGVTTSFKKIENSAESASKGFNLLNGSVASFVGNIASQAVSSFISGLQNLAGTVVQNTVAAEQLQTQFTVLTGSVEDATATIAELRQFSDFTPFEAREVAAAGAQLIGFGSAADEVVERIRRIGEVAAATGKPLGDLTLIFGQVQAAGRLTGERLLQLEERAVPIGEALAKTLDVPRTAVRQLVSEGRVSFAQFEAAFNSLSDEGGSAFGALARQSQTLGGLISTLSGVFESLTVDIGNQFLPVLREGAAELIKFIEANRDLVVSLATDALVFFARAAEFAIRTLNVGKAIIDGVVVSFNGLKLLVSEAIGLWLGLAEGVITAAQALETLAGRDPSPLLQKAKENIQLLREASTETSADITKSINDRIATREKEGQQLQDLANKFEQFGDKAKETEQEITQTTISEEEKRRRARERAIAQAREAEAQRLQAIRDVQAEFATEEQIANIDAQIAKEEADAADIERIRALELQKIEIIRDAEIKKAEEIADANERVRAQETARQKAKIATIKANSKAEIDLEKQKQQTVTSVADVFNSKRNQNLKSSLGTIATLQSNSNKKLFAIGKAAALSQATIDGVAAVQKALTATIPPFNFALAALVGVASAANIAKIASAQPPSAGNFQDGGIVGGNSFSGDNLTANVNSGELILNRSQQQRLFNIANGQDQGSNSEGLTAETVRDIVETTVREMQVVLVADDTEIARSASRGVQNGIIIAGT